MQEIHQKVKNIFWPSEKRYRGISMVPSSRPSYFTPNDSLMSSDACFAGPLTLTI